jgi:hypothetical protein
MARRIASGRLAAFRTSQAIFDHDRRIVEVRVCQLPAHLGGADDGVDAHERQLPGRLVVSVGHGDDDALVERLDQVERRIDHGVVEAGLGGARVGEDELDARGLQLLDHQFTAGAGHLAGRGRRGAILWNGREHVSRRTGREACGGQRLNEASPG